MAQELAAHSVGAAVASKLSDRTLSEVVVSVQVRLDLQHGFARRSPHIRAGDALRVGVVRSSRSWAQRARTAGREVVSCA